jgi:hypothetical protein
MVSGFSQTQQYIFILFTMTCFGQLTIIRPSLQNLEYGTRSARSIHMIKKNVFLPYSAEGFIQTHSY